MKIEIEKPARKFLAKQPNEGDIKPISGHPGFFRLRVGTYRVLYTIENDVLIVRVLDIGNRGDVYK